MEDPSDDFARLRDFVDTKNCLSLDSFSKSKLNEGFSQAMVEEAQKKLKLNKVQYNMHSLIFFFLSFIVLVFPYWVGQAMSLSHS